VDGKKGLRTSAFAKCPRGRSATLMQQLGEVTLEKVAIRHNDLLTSLDDVKEGERGKARYEPLSKIRLVIDRLLKWAAMRYEDHAGL
jgi:hypothetical protein